MDLAGTSGRNGRAYRGRHAASWLALDNAANIFPSTVWKKQHHLYRVAVTLRDPIDVPVLQSALEATAARFPSISAGMRTSALWYYLEPTVPTVQPENGRLLRHMTAAERKRCCLRVMYSGCELALEFFHALCDGNAAVIFIKSLTAEYVQQKYGVEIPCSHGVLDRNHQPSARELQDSYLLHAGDTNAPRDRGHAIRLDGTVLPDGQLRCQRLTADTTEVHACAKARGATITELLIGAMMKAILEVRTAKQQRSKKAIRIAVPVNLRKFFDSTTLRNFSLVVIASIDPREKEWTLDELCRQVHEQLTALITPKGMANAVATNVALTQHWIFRRLPLFIKSPLMRVAYMIFGTDTCCLSISNLGRIELPAEMQPYVTNVSCVMDANPSTPHSCTALSYEGRLQVSMCRSVSETLLETAFSRILRELGITVTEAEVV